jgi:hypothetical protein
MLLYLFNGVSKELILIAADFTQHRYNTKGCEDLVLENSLIGDLLATARDLSAQGNDSKDFWKDLTLDKLNPRYPLFPKGTCGQGGELACQVSLHLCFLSMFRADIVLLIKVVSFPRKNF